MMLTDKDFTEMCEKLDLTDEELINRFVADGWILGWNWETMSNEYWSPDNENAKVCTSVCR